MTEATEVEVTQADEARALEIFNDALGDMSSFAEFGWPNYYDGALRTISVYLARHRQSSVPVQGEPVAWMYSRDGTYSRIHKSQQPSRYHGWTETPLYTHAPTERERVLLPATVDRGIMASVKLGAWMSAALDDPAVCDAMKADIREWFSAGEPFHAIYAALAAPTHRERVLLEALKDVSRRIKESDEWWMDCPDRGGFDAMMIDAAIAQAQEPSNER
jgi:hypothetical protein